MSDTPIGARHFVALRALLGAYLALHFVLLLPWAEALFGRGGMVPAAVNLTYGYFPNPLNLLDSVTAVQAALVLLAGGAVALAAGRGRLWPFVLWFGWACLLNRNVFIRNPSMPFVGWLLLALPLVPRDLRDPDWRFPRPLFRALWVLLAVGYTLSGLDKAGSPSWQDGSALAHVLSNPLSRDHAVVRWLLVHPDLLRAMTWGALALEIGFLPLALWRRSRPWAWAAMVGMHVGILALVDFADLTWGMLVVHAWTFDARWLAPRRLAEPTVVFFDGVCGLCNETVDLLMAEDRGRVLRFAPLQGETAAGALRPEQVADLDRLVALREGVVLERSEAVLQVLDDIGGPWRLLAVPARLVPRRLRDAVYGVVARHRYRIWGRKETCRLPTPAERAMFLP